MKPKSSFAVGFLFVLAGSVGAAAETMTLIGPDQPAPIIVIGADALASETYAAEELATYLNKITGSTIRIVSVLELRRGDLKVIAIGKSALTSAFDISGLDVEQYVIDVQPNRIAIVGGRRPASLGKQARDAGTLYGVYDFLENLGVRWYRPEPWGEHVPSLKEIELTIGTTTSRKPSYTMRAAMSGGKSYSREETAEETLQAVIWAVRSRTNAGFWSPERAVKFGGLVDHSIGRHNWPFLIPASEYFDEHPEYFALVDGKRVPYDLCPGNPEVQRIIAEKLIAQAKRNPHRSSISVEPSDARGGACQCELCRALGGPPNARIGGQVSNRVSGFGNLVAQTITKEAPWLKVQWLAYSTHTAAPTNLEQLEPNAVIMLCPINGWDDWRNKLLDKSSRSNSLFVRTAKDWSALKPDSLMTFLYYNGYGWPGPLPITRTIADRMRTYRQLGIEGNYLPSVISWGPAGLDFYMYMKLAWNPDLDVDAELDLYYENYYGPAAAPMKAYHERLMTALEEHPHHVFSGGRGLHLMFTPALVEELGGYMDQAQALVKGKPLNERRLFGVWAGYEFARRISAILVLKKKTGIVSVKVPDPEQLAGPPDLDRPAFAGRGSYFQSNEAEQAYRDLVKWMRTVNQKDAVFDMAIKPKDDAAEIIYAKRGLNFGASFLSYLPSDVLISINQSAREEDLLKEF